MPNIGDLAGHLIGLIGDLISSSSARLGPAAIGMMLLVLFVLLALLARPVTRWTTRDLGRLAALPRSLAIAAEAGAGAAVSLGTGGAGPRRRRACRPRHDRPVCDPRDVARARFGRRGGAPPDARISRGAGIHHLRHRRRVAGAIGLAAWRRDAGRPRALRGRL